jgi:hypothetical protein
MASPLNKFRKFVSLELMVLREKKNKKEYSGQGEVAGCCDNGLRTFGFH